MSRILKIDNFEKDFEPKYGLDSGGSCYIIKKSFPLEVISSYDIEELEEPKKLKPVWSSIKCLEGDIISITKSGSFIQFKDYIGFIECRPENISKKGEPDFDRFPKDMIKKIGKNMIDSKPMTLEERAKLIIARE